MIIALNKWDEMLELRSGVLTSCLTCYAPCSLTPLLSKIENAHVLSGVEWRAASVAYLQHERNVPGGISVK